MENMIFTAEENSFIVEAEGKKLRVSYDEFCGSHEDAMKFCKEHGGGDETVENLRFIAKYRDDINKELEKLDKDVIESWYWTNELSWRDGLCAFVVYASIGDVNNENRNNNYARAVSEFLNEYMNAMYNISLESLFEAYWDCRKNKSRTVSASEFEVNYESNLIELHREITTGVYTQRPSITFVITKPDYREIFAAHFRDRIVHHWIRQRIEPLFEQQMIPTTFNCRKGKGTLAAQMYVAQAICDVSANYTRDCYVMKLDVKGFFMSIDRQRICDKVSRFVADRYHEDDADTLQFLLQKVLLNAPEKNC